MHKTSAPHRSGDGRNRCISNSTWKIQRTRDAFTNMVLMVVMCVLMCMVVCQVRCDVLFMVPFLVLDLEHAGA